MNLIEFLKTQDDVAKVHVFEASYNSDLHKTVFSEHSKAESYALFEQRVRILEQLGYLNSDLAEPVLSEVLSIDYVWSIVLPIVQKISLFGKGVIGMAGAPGSGKTTLVDAVSTVMSVIEPDKKSIGVSIDDFYYSKAQREARGIAWRAQPGSHNLDTLAGFFDSVNAQSDTVHVPRFNHAVDDVAPSDTVAGPIDYVFFEGWFVGMSDHGYDVLSNALDYLIFIDCSISFSKMRRFHREQTIRERSNGAKGFSEAQMQSFWDEVLEPGIINWVQPVKSKADLVVSVEKYIK